MCLVIRNTVPAASGLGARAVQYSTTATLWPEALWLYAVHNRAALQAVPCSLHGATSWPTPIRSTITVTAAWHVITGSPSSDKTGEKLALEAVSVSTSC